MRRLLTSIFLLMTLITGLSFASEPDAPTIRLMDAGGSEVILPREHAGVDIYFFWASWCPYCKALMSHLQSIKIEYGDAVSIYALNIRDEEDPVEFMDNLGYDFILLPDADSVMDRYGVKGVPGVFLVDGQGKIKFNLYEMIFNDSATFAAQSHAKKATLRAPYWAAKIRTTIDQILLTSQVAQSAPGKNVELLVRK